MAASGRGSGGPSYADVLREERNNLINQAGFEIRDGFDFADAGPRLNFGFGELDEAINLIQHTSRDADGLIDAGRIHGEVVAIHYAQGDLDANDDTYRGELADMVLEHAANLGGFRVTDINLIDAATGEKDKKNYMLLAASVAFLSRNTHAARQDTLRLYGDALDDQEVPNSPEAVVKAQQGFLGKWTVRLAGVATGYMSYKAGVLGDSFIPAMTEGGILGAAGGAIGAAVVDRRREDIFRARTQRRQDLLAENQAVADDNRYLAELRKSRDEDEPDFHDLIDKIEKRLEKEVRRRGNLRAAVMELLRTPALVPEAHDTTDVPVADPESLLEYFRGHAKTLGGYAVRGAATVMVGVLASMVITPSGDSSTKPKGPDTKTPVNPPVTSVKQGTEEDCRVVGATSTTVVINGVQTDCP